MVNLLELATEKQWHYSLKDNFLTEIDALEIDETNIELFKVFVKEKFETDNIQDLIVYYLQYDFLPIDNDIFLKEVRNYIKGCEDELKEFGIKSENNLQLFFLNKIYDDILLKFQGKEININKYLLYTINYNTSNTSDPGLEELKEKLLLLDIFIHDIATDGHNLFLINHKISGTISQYIKLIKYK